MPLVALTLAVVIFAQQTFFSEVLEVRVTNVDVVVTARDGKPVTGLTRDDFLLFEDGAQKEISNFLEIAEAQKPSESQPAADMRRRHIAVFIDNAVLQPSRRSAIIAELREFLHQNIRPGDEVLIASWARSLKLELEPTGDRSAIDDAIRRLDATSTLSFEEGVERERYQRAQIDLIRSYAALIPPAKPPITAGIDRARDYATWALHNSKQRSEALKSLIASLRGVSGRKVLVLVTEALTVNPGEWAFAHLQSIRDQFDGDATVLPDMRQYEIRGMVSDVADAANSSGVTLYAIDGRGKESGYDSKDATINVRFGNRSSLPATSQSALPEIAGQTGGVALSGSTNWKLAFDTIASDLNSYYSLGYRTSGERQDRLKTIEVRLKNKRYNVRTRSAIIERSVSSEMHDAVAANLFRAAGTNDLDIKVAASAATPKDAESVLIPLTITIPIDKLTLLPEGDELTGGFAVYAAFLRKDGAVSKIAQAPQTFRFPANSLKRRKEITVKLEVTADSRTNGISVGVMDQTSRATGFAAVKLALGP